MTAMIRNNDNTLTKKQVQYSAVVSELVTQFLISHT